MVINSEKDLEDYICSHIDNFITDMKKSVWKYRNVDIRFVGRQVRIGGQIADLVFYYETTEKPDENVQWTVKNFIIVELKYRVCETKDLAQLSKYMNLFDSLQDKFGIEDDFYEIHTEGILLGFDLDNNLQEIEMQMYNDGNIHFMNVRQTLYFNNISYSLKEEYVKTMQVDDRILEICKGGEIVGKEENDRSIDLAE